MRSRGVDFTFRSSGVVMGGGTPEHRWVDVAVDAQPGLKILAANDAQLGQVAAEIGVPRERVNIAPAPGCAGYGAPATPDADG